MTEQTHEIFEVAMEEGVPQEPVSADVLRSGLDSEGASVRTSAANVAAGLVSEDPDGEGYQDPETVAEVIPTLIERLYDDQQVVVYHSATALSHLAEDHADDLDQALDRLVELTVHDLPLVRMVAARTLGFVALEHPEKFYEYVDTLVAATLEEPEDVFDDETLGKHVDERRLREAYEDVNRREQTRQSFTRNVTINLLVEIAEHDASLLAPHADAFVDMLLDDDLHVAKGSAEIVGQIARERPAAVEHATDRLLEMLAHPSDAVVATAITSLGFVGDPAAVDPLYEFAEGRDAEDPTHDADVYDLAAETAAYLDR